MEKGDIITLTAGLICVLVVALLMKPGAFFPAPSQAQVPVVTPVYTSPVLTPVMTTPGSASGQSAGRIVVTPADPAYRIFYSSTPFAHPVVRLPENLHTFGSSDIPWRDQDLIPFAFMEESRGGITQNFSVPYDVWMLNITVTSERQPQYARFRMVLCDSNTGGFLEGAEILNRGTMYKIVQVSNTNMYMIIGSENVDQFRITLETPRKYYEKYRAAK